MAEVLDFVPVSVTQVMNDKLLSPFEEKEIKEALFQMGPTKAPSPDGFLALFYQVHWDFIQHEIFGAIQSFLNGSEIPEDFCDSVIILIPKVSRAKHLSKFRPISICNVIYKLASKVVASRLKVILPQVISEFRVLLFLDD
jgi:hypothetical protein